MDEDLSFRMAVARMVVNLGRAARNATQIKTRQPVAKAVVACRERERAAIESLASVVSEELNVKELEYVTSASELVSYVVKPNFRTLGPKFGKNMPGRGGRGRAARGRDRRPDSRRWLGDGDGRGPRI
jgi:isoleucyl-tRNA synthetase